VLRQIIGMGRHGFDLEAWMTCCTRGNPHRVGSPDALGLLRRGESQIRELLAKAGASRPLKGLAVWPGQIHGPTRGLAKASRIVISPGSKFWQRRREMNSPSWPLMALPVFREALHMPPHFWTLPTVTLPAPYHPSIREKGTDVSASGLIAFWRPSISRKWLAGGAGAGRAAPAIGARILSFD